jgi:hypothetical protein
MMMRLHPGGSGSSYQPGSAHHAISRPQCRHHADPPPRAAGWSGVCPRSHPGADTGPPRRAGFRFPRRGPTPGSVITHHGRAAGCWTRRAMAGRREGQIPLTCALSATSLICSRRA